MMQKCNFSNLTTSLWSCIKKCQKWLRQNFGSKRAKLWHFSPWCIAMSFHPIHKLFSEYWRYNMGQNNGGVPLSITLILRVWELMEICKKLEFWNFSPQAIFIIDCSYDLGRQLLYASIRARNIHVIWRCIDRAGSRQMWLFAKIITFCNFHVHDIVTNTLCIGQLCRSHIYLE